MPNFTAGTSFTDGVTNDVTAAKLNALIADAVPTSSLSLNSTTGTISQFSSGTGTAASPAIQPTGDTNTGIFFPAADTIGFSGGGNELMRIDSSGRVGIGTTTPGVKLHISSGSADAQMRIESTGGASYDQSIHFKDTASDWYIGNKYSGATNSFGVGRTQAKDDLVIDSSGQVGIGTASPSAQLELSTDSAKKPSTNTWTIASDSRLKTNITEADKDRCLEIVRQIPLKRYTWKNEVYSKEVVKDRSKLGWIAQDVESVFPKAVGTNRFAYNQVFEDVVTPELDEDGNAVLDEDGNAKTKTEKRLVSEDVIEDCKDLNSDQIYAVMYGAIQKLAEENDSLKARIAALEAA